MIYNLLVGCLTPFALAGLAYLYRAKAIRFEERVFMSGYALLIPFDGLKLLGWVSEAGFFNAWLVAYMAYILIVLMKHGFMSGKEGSTS